MALTEPDGRVGRAQRHALASLHVRTFCCTTLCAARHDYRRRQWLTCTHCCPLPPSLILAATAGVAAACRRHGARGAPGGGRRSSNGGGECRERRRRSPGAPQHLKNHRSEAAGPARGRAHPTLAWVVATRPRVPSLPPKKKKGKGFRVRGTTITGAARRCASSGAGWRACSSACSTHQPPHTLQYNTTGSGQVADVGGGGKALAGGAWHPQEHCAPLQW